MDKYYCIAWLQIASDTEYHNRCVLVGLFSNFVGPSITSGGFSPFVALVIYYFCFYYYHLFMVDAYNNYFLGTHV